MCARTRVYRWNPGLEVTDMIYDDKPGGYDRVMVWLAGHSPATVSGICHALGVTRSRALLILRVAERNGDVSRTQKPYPNQWTRTQDWRKT